MEKKHPWRARLGVGIAMLILSFVGMILTDIEAAGGWNYWRWTVPIYALLALWLSWYLRKREFSFSAVTLWHELLHWVGLIASVFLITFFVDLGILSRFLAGLCVLTLLAQAIFIAGIYIESTFIWIGIVIGLLTCGVAFLEEYLYAFAIPLLLLGAGAVTLAIWRSHRKHHPKS